MSKYRILNILIKTNILVIVFLLPLFFAVFFQTNNVFELNKIVLFKILVILSAFFTFVKLFLEARILKIIKTNFKNKLLIPFLVLFTVISISTFFSVNREVSFFGDYDRQLGLVAYIYFFLFFFILIINIKSRKEINSIIKTAAFSSFFVSLYGLVQTFGFDTLSWSESASTRVVSTLGQPNYLGSYLVLLMPVTLYLGSYEKNRFLKVFFIFVLFLQALTLFFTYSISSWLALVITITTFLFSLLLNYYKKNKAGSLQKYSFVKYIKYFLSKKFIIVSFLVVVLFVTIAFQNKSWVLDTKISSIINPEKGSTSARVDFWSASIKAIKEKPFFGHGPETQGEVLVKYYKKDWGVHSNVGVQPNRAHNFFLDTLLTLGIFGLLAYLFFLAYFIKLIIENTRKNKGKNLSLAILFSILAYFITLLFNFTFITGEVYLFLLFAIIYLLNKNDFSEKEEMITPTRKNLFTYVWLLFFVTSLGYISFELINKQTRALEADHYYWQTRVSKANNDFTRSLVLYQYIKDSSIYDYYYMRAYPYFLTDWIVEMDELGRVYRFMGEKKLNDILPKIDKNNFEDNHLRGKIYSVLAGAENPDYYNESENNFKKAIAISPQMPIPYRDLAKMYFKKGDYEKAIENFQKSNENLPNINNPNLNLDHKNIVKRELFFNYIGLGDTYLELPEEEESKKYYDLAEGIYR